MSNGNQTWVLVVIAVVGLLLVGMALKQCGSSSQEEALSEDVEQRVAAIGRRGERTGLNADEPDGEGDSMATGSGRGRGRQHSDRESASSGRESDTGGSASSGSAQTVRDELRRRGQRAAAAAGSAKVNAPPAMAAGGSGARDDPFKEARERVASRSNKTAPLTAPAAAVPEDGSVADPNGSIPSETPVLSVLAKEENVADPDEALVHNNGATYEAGEGHVFDTESQVKIPNAGNIKGDQGSIAFELKPKWEGADQTNATFFDLRTPNEWNNRMELVKTGESLRFLMWDSEGKENGVAFQMKEWAPDESHPIVVTWGADETGQRVMSLWEGGQLRGQTTYEHDFDVPNGQPLVIGNNAGGQVGARSVLNGFQVYNKVLDGGRISSLDFK